MKKKTYNIKGEGERCPKCRNPMQRREHKRLRRKQMDAAYYYSEWDYCAPCKHVQHYDRYKVTNRNDRARRLQDFQEHQAQLEFLRGI